MIGMFEKKHNGWRALREKKSFRKWSQRGSQESDHIYAWRP